MTVLETEAMKPREPKCKPGDICMTNVSQPGGLVEVISVSFDGHLKRYIARIKHIEDHPYGYTMGTLGDYFDDELIVQV